MLKRGSLLAVGLLTLVIPPSSAATGSFGTYFETLKHQLREEFSPEIGNLNETWRAFLQARFRVNETASHTPWLVETIPGSGEFRFDIAGLANFKSKVMEMVEKKNKYLADKAELTQAIMLAAYNMSMPYFEAMQGRIGDRNNDGGENKANLLSAIRRIFGLGFGSESKTVRDENGKGVRGNAADDDKDKENEAEHFDNDSVFSTILDFSTDETNENAFQLTSATSGTPHEAQPTTAAVTPLKPTPTSRSKENRRGYPWWNWAGKHSSWDFEAAKKRQNRIKNKIQQGLENRNKWQQFAQRKAGGAGAVVSSPSASPAWVDSNVNTTLNDIKAKLWEQFEPTIKQLNDSRNAFLQAKADMVESASQRAWQQRSLSGGVTFHPEELMAFKTKIKDMVAMKNEYVAEKVQLKQDMLEALQELLLSHLDQVKDLSKTSAHAPEPGKAIAPVGQTTDVILSRVGQTTDAILKEMLQLDSSGSGDDISDDVTEGLPFGRSLMLAAAPPSALAGGGGSAAGSGGGEGGEVIALVVFGVLAVVAAAALVMGVALRQPGRRGLYTRMA